MNEITIIYKPRELRKYMKSKEARAIYGRFYLVGKTVEYTVCGVSQREADTFFTDDLSELRSGNVEWY